MDTCVLSAATTVQNSDMGWANSRYANVNGIDSVITLMYNGKQIQIIIMENQFIADACSDFIATKSRFQVKKRVLSVRLVDYENVQKGVLKLRGSLFEYYMIMEPKRREIQNKRFEKYTVRGFTIKMPKDSIGADIFKYVTTF
jgi:hypothetical protein